MQARRVKAAPNKNRCDRCQQERPPLAEYCFSFRKHGFYYWKKLWQGREGRRLTRRRDRQIQANEEKLDLRALSDVCFWMDLCEPCWEECRQPWEAGFPSEFWQDVLRRPAPVQSAALVVPEITPKSAPKAAVRPGRLTTP